MPLVGGDLCPIAIDVVEKFQIVGEDPIAAEDIDEPEVEVPVPVPEEEFDSPLHYVDQKEEGPTDADMHPIIEKGEHHDEDEEEYGVYPGDFHDEYHFDDTELYFERVIPEKHEHNLEDDYEQEY